MGGLIVGLFVERGNELFFEVCLCERRHEVRGLSGQIVIQGIFPTTVEKILDIEGHTKIVRETLEPIPKTVTVIVYVTGCQPLLQAFYVWLNNALHHSILPRIILAHYDRNREDYRYYCANYGNEIYL